MAVTVVARDEHCFLVVHLLDHLLCNLPTGHLPTKTPFVVPPASVHLRQASPVLVDPLPHVAR